MHWIPSLLAFGTLVMGVACGAAATENDVGTGSEAVTGDTKASCPPSLPPNGTACSQKGEYCSWGDDPRFGCRAQSTCDATENGLAWEQIGGSCPEPAPSCPASAPTANADCSKKDIGLTCVYDDVAYTCDPCSGTLCFQKATWATTALATGCPSAEPNLGDSCTGTKSGLYCNYNVCADDQSPPYNDWAYGMGMKCQGETWTFSTDNQACL